MGRSLVCGHAECVVDLPCKRTVDEPAISSYGQSDTRSTDQVTPEERILKTVEELAARWHRHSGEELDFPAGMRAGWVQAIGLLLGTSVADVNASLHGGRL